MNPAAMQERNRELGRQIHEEARRDPHSPYANKFVGIANGQIVVVADSLGDMLRQLRQAEPDPTKTYGIDTAEDPNEVHQVWRAG